MPQDNELLIKLALEDKEALSKLDTALKKIDSQSKSATSSMSANWAKAAAVITGVAVATEGFRRFMGEAIRASIEQEDATNRLNGALQAQGTLTDEVAKSYQDLASSMQATTRFADEAVLGVMQTLVSVGNIVPSKMAQATQATLDLATVLKIDLQSAGLLVAKASEGNTTALSRYGIVIDETIPKAQKFEELLRLVAERHGGAAQRDINTYSGATTVLGNAWGDFMEEIGNMITQSPEVVGGIKNITAALTEMTTLLKDNKDVVGSFMSGFSQAGMMGGAAGAAQSIFKKIFGGTEEEKAAVVQAVQETQTQIGMMQDQFTLERQAIKAAFAEGELQNTILGEQTKIDTMRTMWAAYHDEEQASILTRQQQEQEKYNFYLDTKKKADQSYWVAAGKLRDTFSAGVSQMFQSAIEGNLKFGDALKQLGMQMVKILIDFAVQKAINYALSKTLMAGEAAAVAAFGLTTANALAPAAAFMSVITFGGAAAAGSAALAAAVGLAKTMANLPGLAEGGTLTGAGSVLVGERGPELLHLPKGASVVPLDGGGGGGTSIVININNPTGRIDEALMTMMKREVSEFIDYEMRRL